MFSHAVLGTPASSSEQGRRAAPSATAQEDHSGLPRQKAALREDFPRIHLKTQLIKTSPVRSHLFSHTLARVSVQGVCVHPGDTLATTALSPTCPQRCLLQGETEENRLKHSKSKRSSLRKESLRLLKGASSWPTTGTRWVREDAVLRLQGPCPFFPTLCSLCHTMAPHGKCSRVGSGFYPSAGATSSCDTTSFLIKA